jgi:hypothetical protein
MPCITLPSRSSHRQKAGVKKSFDIPSWRQIRQFLPGRLATAPNLRNVYRISVAEEPQEVGWPLTEFATMILAQNSDSDSDGDPEDETDPEKQICTMPVDDWSPALGGLRNIAPEVTAIEKQESKQRYLEEAKRGLSFKREQTRRYGRTPLTRQKSSVTRVQGLRIHSVVRYTID